MTDWLHQGCAHCRQGILAGTKNLPRQVASSVMAHAHLRHCDNCGSWWVEGEREAHTVVEAEARQTFPEHFVSPKK
jgi:hypothetical protein